MKAHKVALLVLILGLGGALETAWSVRNHLGIGAAGCRVLGGKFYGPSFSFEEATRQPLEAGMVVDLENAFGGVHIESGEPGMVRVALRKVVFLSGEERAKDFASRLHLRVAVEGSTLRISTNREEVAAGNPGVGFETHLEIRVPAGTRVKVRNEHGPLEVTDVGPADLESSFDDLRAERVAGSATLKNRHGDVAAAGIQGTLTLSARYGDVDVRDVQGRAAIEIEHGDLSAKSVAGLTLDLNYGDLSAEDVRGDLEVRGEHNGVRASGVTGRAVIAASYQDVDVAKVGGEVSVKAEHSEVRVAEARAAVVVETSYDDVSLADVDGPVEVTVEHGGLQGRGLARGVKARVSGDDVVLDSFEGPVTIEARRSSVRLVPRGALASPVSVSTSNGDIRLVVAAGSRFDLDATVEAGEIGVGGVPGLAVSESARGRIAGRVGGGGEAVTLRADHGDVRLEPSSAVASRED